MKVSVKWSGKKFDDIELDTSQPGLVFKTQLYTLTGVEPDRQKILVKGGVLKDDSDWSTLGVKEMMGTAGELPKAPVAPIQFMEDMNETQLAKALKVPAGLTNLGNTCYLNATLQCLRAIPELRSTLSKIPKTYGNDGLSNLVSGMSNLMNQLEDSGDAVSPIVFLQVLRMAFPQFAEQNNHGFMQQDAEECWGQIVSVLSDKVPGHTATGELETSKKFVDQFMTGETVETTTCDDAPTETPTMSVSTFRQMKVNIGSGVSTYMLTDIQNGLTEKINKRNESLGRDATYTKVSKISRLPKYLTFNFVRFQWKPVERVYAKILKKVKFPFILDMGPLCTLELQEKMSPAKLYLKEKDEKEAAAKKLKKAQEATNSMDIDAPAATSSKTEEEIFKEINLDSGLASDIGVNVSGQYELVAVLTHVGRTAVSGHYIGWAKNEKGEWWKFDDDTVSLVNEEEITKLEGGGDWHTAYIILYKARSLV
ncbi:Ubiquitin carboxyl-terminal hydrolase 14 [Blyttiomyces sp. JEL0837]|nr:Ubiquitin carboxyl-terminal hydrolase 14 [Blyttiomyces sp. JEL0837]